jgi:hypoxanthine phosphoribosyltransferase
VSVSPLAIERPLTGSIEVVFDEALIGNRVAELAAMISRDYAGRDLVLVGILKGAQPFTCDLSRALSVPAIVDFASISRYRRAPGLKDVRIIHDVEVDLGGKDVLVVEDIIDTGLTLHYLVQEFQQRRPESIALCSLLDRPDLRLADIRLDYTGFEVSEEFLVGYGLDFREQYRNLPYIGRLEI